MTKTNEKYTWHLTAEGQVGILTTFEFSLWRVFYPFMAWQEECEKYTNGNKFSAYDIAIFHVIKIQDKPKTVNDICNLLNRHDVQTIHYSIKKLINLGLVTSTKDPNTRAGKLYSVTEKGNKSIERYCAARADVLQGQLEKFAIKAEDLEKLELTLIRLKGLYEEIYKILATYNDETKLNSVKDKSNE